MIIKVLFLVVKRSKLTEEDQIKEFISTYPTFFEEFKNRRITD
jgi:hypothetical protein